MDPITRPFGFRCWMDGPFGDLSVATESRKLKEINASENDGGKP